MADDKHTTDQQPDVRVDINDSSELEHLRQYFPLKSYEEIKKAIKEAGPLRTDIIAYLRGS